jgi:iron complex outermembrane receptor protein
MAASAVALLAQPAFAQTANGSSVEPQAPKTSQIEDIVVTAQRRAQSVMAVPLSIQATTGEQLNNSGIRDLTALSQTTPGFTPLSGAGFTQIFVRGIGNSLYIGADPSVAYFVDDVPRIYGSMADNLIDVERVEILKGAQGGLYGRNSTGGAVNVITRAPNTEALEGGLRASYGEKNTFAAAGHINVPLGDRAAWTLSAQRETHDPYVKNIARANPYTAAMFPTGSYLGTSQATADFFNAGTRTPDLEDQDFWAARTKLLLKPSDDFQVTFAGDYYDKQDAGGVNLAGQTPAYNQAFLTDLFGSLGINAVLPAGFVQTPGKFESSMGADVYVNTTEYGFSGTAVWNAPGFDLTSITAYRHQETAFTSPLGGEVLDIPSTVAFEKEYTYQEFRAVSTFEGPWRLLGGATYLDNQQTGTVNLSFLSPAFAGGSTAVADKVVNWSVYAQAGYDFTPALSLTVSGRYMHETNEALFTQPIVSSSDTEEEKFVPSVTLSYAFEGGGNAYARWAQGFKTGGINLVTAPAYFPSPSDGSLFGPETVDTYEVGIKRSLFDRSVQVTGAVFYNDYKGIQADGRALPAYAATVTTAVINADSARTYGAEASVNWRVSDPLTVGVNAGYLNAKYEDFSLSGSSVLADFDLSGKQMPKAPKWQLGFNANLDQPITADLRLVGSLLVSYSSEAIIQSSSQPGVLPDAVRPSYTLVNARIGVRTGDDRYGFAIVGDNLFNEDYFQFGASNVAGNTLGHGKPRIIRAEITANF